MKIYLITNRKLVSNEEEFLQVIKECSENGVDNIILREKDLGLDDLVKLGNKVKEVIDENKTKLILNSNIEGGIKLKAYGIHLPFQEFIKVDNKLIYDFKEVGVSVHSLEEAIEADKKGASYVLVSHIFNTECKKGLEPKGVDFISKVKKEVSCKVVALGGILPSNVKEVKNTGCEGIAVMSTLMKSKDIKGTLKEYRE